MMDIPIDEQGVHDELRAIEGEYIASGDAGPQPQPGAASGEQQASPMDWTIPAGLVVMILDRVVAPNWQLEPGEKEMIHTQTVQTLTVCFPTINLDPRIVAVMSLGGVLAAIGARRIDLESGTIKPLRAAPDDDGKDERREAA